MNNRNIDYLSDRYAKILQLADRVDPVVVDRIDKYSESIEDRAINYIVKEQSFHRTSRNETSFLFYEVNDKFLDLELAEGCNDKFVLRKLMMKPLNRETMTCFAADKEEDRTIRLVHFTTSNIPEDPEFQMNVEQNENGLYKIKSVATNGVLCFEYQVDLRLVNNKYVLSSTKLISNCEKYTKEVEISEMDLVDYTSPMGNIAPAIYPSDIDNKNQDKQQTIYGLSDEDIDKLIDGLDDLFGSK